MKKITKTLLMALPLFAMMAVTTSCGTDTSDDVAVTRPGKANDSIHSIAVSCDDAVVVTVASSATSGTRVDVALEFNAEEYKVTNVLINNEMAVKNSETSYSFSMPSADVTLTVKGEYIDPTHGKHLITNVEADKGVNLIGLPTHAKAGEALSFKVQFVWDSAFSFNNVVEVYTVNGEGAKLEDVPVTSLVGEYTFTMPNSDIAVKVGTVEKRFSYKRNTETTSNIQNTYTSNDNWETQTSSPGDLIVTAGTLFKITLKDTDSIRATGIKLETNKGEFSYDADESKVVMFTMPASDVVMTVVGEINYKTITIEQNEHLTIELLEQTADGEYVEVEDLEHFLPSSYVYVRVTSNDEENYLVGSLSVKNGTSNVSTYTVPGQTNMWRFTMPNSDNVTVSATAKEILFKDYEFVGKYYGANLYSDGKKEIKNADNSYTVTIDAIGNLTKGTSSSPTKTIKSATAQSGDGLGVFTDNKEFCYGDEFIFAHYSFSNTLDGQFGKDWIVAVKAVDPADTYGMYSFRYVIPSTGRSFIAVEALRKVGDVQEVCGTMFFDTINKRFYDTGVSFELTAGETIIDASAVFNVKVGDVAIGTVNVASGTFTLAE